MNDVSLFKEGEDKFHKAARPGFFDQEMNFDELIGEVVRDGSTMMILGTVVEIRYEDNHYRRNHPVAILDNGETIDLSWSTVRDV